MMCGLLASCFRVLILGMDNLPSQSYYYQFCKSTHSSLMLGELLVPALREGLLHSFPPAQQCICTRHLVCSLLFLPIVDLNLSLSREADTSFSERENKEIGKGLLQKGFGKVLCVRMFRAVSWHLCFYQ